MKSKDKSKQTLQTLNGKSEAYLIFVIFSPRRQFLVQFFSTQKCVNRDKTDFGTKVRKSQQNQFSNKTAQIAHMWRHFSHHTLARCGEISYFSTSVIRRNLKLLHTWRKFRFLHICHVKLLQTWRNFRILHICHA